MIERALRCRVRGVIIADAGFGMDMDLPEDYARLEAYLTKVGLAPAASPSTDGAG
jgi:hypothetical protein